MYNPNGGSAYERLMQQRMNRGQTGGLFGGQRGQYSSYSSSYGSPYGGYGRQQPLPGAGGVAGTVAKGVAGAAAVAVAAPVAAAAVAPVLAGAAAVAGVGAVVAGAGAVAVKTGLVEKGKEAVGGAWNRRKDAGEQKAFDGKFCKSRLFQGTFKCAYDGSNTEFGRYLTDHGILNLAPYQAAEFIITDSNNKKHRVSIYLPEDPNRVRDDLSRMAVCDKDDWMDLLDVDEQERMFYSAEAPLFFTLSSVKAYYMPPRNKKVKSEKAATVGLLVRSKAFADMLAKIAAGKLELVPEALYGCKSLNVGDVVIISNVDKFFSSPSIRDMWGEFSSLDPDGSYALSEIKEHIASYRDFEVDGDSITCNEHFAFGFPRQSLPSSQRTQDNAVQGEIQDADLIEPEDEEVQYSTRFGRWAREQEEDAAGAADKPPVQGAGSTKHEIPEGITSEQAHQVHTVDLSGGSKLEESHEDPPSTDAHKEGATTDSQVHSEGQGPLSEGSAITQHKDSAQAEGTGQENDGDSFRSGFKRIGGK